MQCLLRLCKRFRFPRLQGGMEGVKVAVKLLLKCTSPAVKAGKATSKSLIISLAQPIAALE